MVPTTDGHLVARPLPGTSREFALNVRAEAGVPDRYRDWGGYQVTPTGTFGRVDKSLTDRWPQGSMNFRRPVRQRSYDQMYSSR